MNLPNGLPPGFKTRDQLHAEMAAAAVKASEGAGTAEADALDQEQADALAFAQHPFRPLDDPNAATQQAEALLHRYTEHRSRRSADDMSDVQHRGGVGFGLDGVPAGEPGVTRRRS